MGPAFQPFAGPIFHRCINIIHTNLQQAAQAANNQAWDYPDKDFLVTSLDLLSTLIQALDGTSSELVASAKPHFFELLSLCLSVSQDPNLFPVLRLMRNRIQTMMFDNLHMLYWAIVLSLFLVNYIHGYRK